MAAKKENKGSNAMYWVVGAAATAGVFYFVQRYLKDRDQLMEMRLMEKLRASQGNPPKQLPEGE